MIRDPDLLFQELLKVLATHDIAMKERVLQVMKAITKVAMDVIPPDEMTANALIVLAEAMHNTLIKEEEEGTQNEW